jgi:large subunit ribosomal protein L21
MKSGDFSVIKTGGKQYIARVGETLKIEKIKGVNEGDAIKFDTVLLTAKGDKVEVGSPAVKGATVSGTISKVARDKKILVMHYKQKSRYMKRNGHRQPFMLVKVSAL